MKIDSISKVFISFTDLSLVVKTVLVDWTFVSPFTNLGTSTFSNINYINSIWTGIWNNKFTIMWFDTDTTVKISLLSISWTTITLDNTYSFNVNLVLDQNFIYTIAYLWNDRLVMSLKYRDIANWSDPDNYKMYLYLFNTSSSITLLDTYEEPDYLISFAQQIWVYKINDTSFLIWWFRHNGIEYRDFWTTYYIEWDIIKSKSGLIDIQKSSSNYSQLWICELNSNKKFFMLDYSYVSWEEWMYWKVLSK